MGSYDLTNPQSMNRYAYVLNNPLSLIDPSGLDPICNTDPDTGLLECTSYYSGDGGDGGDLVCWWCMEYGGGGGGPIECWWCRVPPGGVLLGRW